MEKKSYKPVVLIILDGWGINPSIEGNTVKAAKLPSFDYFWKNYPATALQASGISVGLFWGENGNSEVGHLNLGSGLVIYQNLPRITLSIQNKTFFKNEIFLSACEHVKKNDSALHLMGLVSAGGIHSHIDHLFALLELAKAQRVKRVYIHAFTDGRDTPRNVAERYLQELEEKLRQLHLGEIATVSGRFYAMDRDNRWDREELAYNAMVLGLGPTAESARSAISESYVHQTYDEAITPTVITQNGHPIATIKDNDAVIFFNFRADRARQLTKAFVLPSFDNFSRPHRLENLYFATMTQYEENLPVHIAFSPQKVVEPLAKVISDHRLKQFRIAETEKYAHVTYFFDGGIEKPFPGEDQLVIPSPKVKNYDQVPEMSAQETTDILIKKIFTGYYSFLAINYANPDMIGHTGNFNATVKALEFVDKKIKEVVEATLSINGVVIITADHGNCEAKIDPLSHESTKEHTTNPVPFLLLGNDFKIPPKDDDTIFQEMISPSGVLADVAPTILDLMGIKKPEEMTGLSLRNSMTDK